jgi:hypothetical protein
VRYPVVRDFIPEDMLAIPFNPALRVEGTHEDLLDWGRRHKEAGPCVSMTLDGEVYASGGFRFLNSRGVAEIWTTIRYKPPVGVVMAVRRQMLEWVRDYSIKVLLSLVIPGWQSGKRFTEWLGFKDSGKTLLMNDINYLVYVRPS